MVAVVAWAAFAGIGCKAKTGAGGGASAEPPGGGTSGGATKVKIVSSLPRTGSANAQTTTIVNGIRLALDEASYKVGDFTIEFEDWDDASAKKGDWDPEVEAANADRAANDKDILFYLGTYNSGAAKISMPVLNKAGVVMISPGNTYPGLTKPGTGEPNEPAVYRPSGRVTYYRVVPADDIQGKVGAQFAKQRGLKSVYVLYDGGLYGQGIANVFANTAEDIGLKVLSPGAEKIDPKAQEYRSLMTKIKALKPDLVYFGGTTQANAGQVAKDMVAVGLTAKLMVPDGCFENAFIEAAGAQNVNGRAFITFGGLPPEELKGKGAEFVKNYRAKFHGEPEGYAVYGYVAGKVALEALAKAGKKDRDAVREAMVGMGQTDGALGTWKFDANGDTSLTAMSVNTVKDGKFAFVALMGGGNPPANEPGKDPPK
ncbi:MAG TPA: branched-chain amino acid ABC transporter substrate-binding protein [Polyangia bacterium]|nr:branched-chain amino acid ABC transporter substrate-binding protein [Polyangia bacterium]